MRNSWRKLYKILQTVLEATILRKTTSIFLRRTPGISGTWKKHLEGQGQIKFTVTMQCEASILQFNQILNPTKKSPDCQTVSCPALQCHSIPSLFLLKKILFELLLSEIYTSFPTKKLDGTVESSKKDLIIETLSKIIR